MAQKSDISVETANATSGKPNPPSPKSRLAMLKRTKKASNASSDPFRFQNNGISYKGKLIGEQDVDKARGDAMCAEAMRTAKSIIKAAGAHKTRITLQINIDGIKVLDEKSGAVLHNFPVSRISFIARDSSDARAFGLVYGEPGGKYKFYGIKTAQAADQAVLAIRDMFQVVFEMKKKQIEQVKQQQIQDGGAEISSKKEGGVAVADLLDLESELQQIERGVQQLSTVPTNCDAFGASPFGDPFVDSFNSTATSNGTANMSGTQVPFGGLQLPQVQQMQMPMVQIPQQSHQNWPTSGAGSFDAWGQQQQQQQMHHAHSTPAFGTNGFSDTNPFASAFNTQAPPPPLPTVAPTQYRDPFSVHSSAIPNSNIDWTGTGTTKENMAPSTNIQQQQSSLHHASTFANFGDNKFRAETWSEKKVTSLEEAFTKLVDMDALVGGQGIKETKKNPFEHILNPPKASLNSMSTTCSAAQMAATQQHTTSSHADPFGDDFFR
ncbi:PID domain-containing protein [Caenorhabditis elegans]|uniref:PID domain-containing protein n=1 Tax=Caenorhabditis elegans TaxID=6239 RepID=Q9U3A6_CAEEL|nr:PID domain-containing protein [Caenorhabditis elegans]CAB54271.4 PID domain-containing protein [Caenorhabditis elegans]|eukprot:NP_495730.3 DAB (Drosophila disabled) homolog [Caenorhabditis elegans]